MNYLEQIVGFHRWKEVNPLPASAIALWHEIMAVCNKAGWPEEFTAPNAVLQANAGVSRKEFDRARQMLIDFGLIHYKKSNRVNNAGKYSLNKFPIVQNGQRKVQQEEQRKEQQEAQQEAHRAGQPSGDRADHQGDNERGTLFKHKLKLNEREIEQARETLRKLVISLEMKKVGIDGLETVYSYIGQCDVEVIEKALKISEGKHIPYFVEVINNEFIAKGKTTAESIKPIPKGGQQGAETGGGAARVYESGGRTQGSSAAGNSGAWQAKGSGIKITDDQYDSLGIGH